MEKIDLSDLKAKSPLLGILIDAGLLNEQGIKVSGIGMLIKNLDALIPNVWRCVAFNKQNNTACGRPAKFLVKGCSFCETHIQEKNSRTGGG